MPPFHRIFLSIGCRHLFAESSENQSGKFSRDLMALPVSGVEDRASRGLEPTSFDGKMRQVPGPGRG